jgi:23S rRNA (adenine2503-C2)-methyltransferase
MTQANPRRDIKDLSRSELTQWLHERGAAAYRAAQIQRWIYRGQVDDFAAMTDLGKTLRLDLENGFQHQRLELLDTIRSADGSCKYLFGLQDGRRIECVLMPERDHYTLCISSQVGCPLACSFCLTGRTGFERNLTIGEILSQVRDVRYRLSDPEKLTNIVFMGMGEPLANYDHVVAAIGTLTDSEAGLGLAARRITLSTAGLAERLAHLGRDTRVNLAISLNAVDNDTRTRLMPINRTYPLEQLLEACRNYPLPRGRRITFEYILLHGINDRPEDARRLCRLLRPIKAKINLIPFNEHPGCDFRRPPEEAVRQFQQALLDRHFTAVVRISKGQDISAACGQLYAGRRLGNPTPETRPA